MMMDDERREHDYPHPADAVFCEVFAEVMALTREANAESKVHRSWDYLARYLGAGCPRSKRCG
jgi:hypothetical protein